MRSVPIAAFKDNVARYVAQAHAGEEIVVTRHGKPMARVVPADATDKEQRRKLVADIEVLRAEMLGKSGAISTDQVLDWISEGRAEREEQLWRSLS